MLCLTHMYKFGMSHSYGIEFHRVAKSTVQIPLPFKRHCSENRIDRRTSRFPHFLSNTERFLQ